MSKYQLVRNIGSGGFGVVDEVVNARGEHFARKTFRPAGHIPTAAHEKLKKRFKREVRIQAELGGQEIMPVIASDLNADAPWFIMPLAAKTYEKQIEEDRKRGSVDVDAVADILNGLQVLHDLAYVHRDLNPKNILLHDEHWKLSDLGAVLPPSGQTVTMTEDTVIYTEQYCSPEQRNDFHTAQSPSDIYSFGCILHDLFGIPPRRPYAKQSAAGPIGLIIEKCTEVKPDRRPSIRVLRDILLEALVEVGGHCKIDDKQAEAWLERLNSMEKWNEEEYAQFARFFAELDLRERSKGHESEWVNTLSTPFMTRIPADALQAIVMRGDGIAEAIVEKYCEWVRNTAFGFYFADSVCSRLCAIYDSGTAAFKAQSIIALIELGQSHNRWYVMREMLRRCGKDRLTKEEGKRIAIEIRTEEVETEFGRCISEVQWDKAMLAGDIQVLV